MSENRHDIEKRLLGYLSVLSSLTDSDGNLMYKGVKVLRDGDVQIPGESGNQDHNEYNGIIKIVDTSSDLDELSSLPNGSLVYVRNNSTNIFNIDDISYRIGGEDKYTIIYNPIEGSKIVVGSSITEPTYTVGDGLDIFCSNSFVHGYICDKYTEYNPELRYFDISGIRDDYRPGNYIIELEDILNLDPVNGKIEEGRYIEGLFRADAIHIGSNSYNTFVGTFDYDTTIRYYDEDENKTREYIRIVLIPVVSSDIYERIIGTIGSDPDRLRGLFHNNKRDNSISCMVGIKINYDSNSKVYIGNGYISLDNITIYYSNDTVIDSDGNEHDDGFWICGDILDGEGNTIDSDTAFKASITQIDNIFNSLPSVTEIHTNEYFIDRLSSLFKISNHDDSNGLYVMDDGVFVKCTSEHGRINKSIQNAYDYINDIIRDMYESDELIYVTNISIGGYDEENNRIPVNISYSDETSSTIYIPVVSDNGSNDEHDCIIDGHDYEGVITTEPTCVDNGVKTYTCKFCGESYTEIIQSTGHSYDDGVITTEPTQSEAGVKTYTCQVCGHTYTEPVYGEDEYSWSQIHDIVSSGNATNEFSLGDVLTVHHDTYGDLSLRIIGFDQDTVYDSNDSLANHSMTVEFENIVDYKQMCYTAQYGANTDYRSNNWYIQNYGYNDYTVSSMRTYLNSTEQQTSHPYSGPIEKYKRIVNIHNFSHILSFSYGVINSSEHDHMIDGLYYYEDDGNGGYIPINPNEQDPSANPYSEGWKVKRTSLGDMIKTVDEDPIPGKIYLVEYVFNYLADDGNGNSLTSSDYEYAEVVFGSGKSFDIGTVYYEYIPVYADNGDGTYTVIPEDTDPTSVTSYNGEYYERYYIENDESSYSGGTVGFMYGLDQDFVSVLGYADKRCINFFEEVTTIRDRIFLLSNAEVCGPADHYYGDDGFYDKDTGNYSLGYQYYEDNVDPNNKGTWNTDNSRIKFNSDNNASQYWLRSSVLNYPYSIATIGDSGYVTSDSMNCSYGVAPACCII